MIHFTFSGVMISILCCNLLILFMRLVFSSHTILLNTSFRVLDSILLIILIRLLFPFELPITTNIYFPSGISYIISSLLKKYTLFSEISVSIWDFILVLWFLVFFYKLYNYIKSNKRFYQNLLINTSDITTTKPYAELLGDVCKQLGCGKTVHIMQSSFIHEPAVYHYWNYYILMPEGLQLSTNEIKNVLSHEIAHIVNHDLLKKTIVQIICLFYWWNPFCKRLSKQIDLLLELQTDKKIGGTTIREKKNYLSCLIKVASQLHPSTENNVYALSFSSESGIILSKRLKLMMDEKQSKQPLLSTMIVLPVCLITFLSFTFIFEPSYVPPEFTQEYIILTKENSYAIQQQDGTYHIYYNDTYLDQSDTLAYYPSDMIVYYYPQTKENHE
ncbi:MAG: M56 family metallopeptidase [Lachnospiraceae bacterium]|nr:M56 family metallopeptidase [Lachnospiraceae bacterium]